MTDNEKWILSPRRSGPFDTQLFCFPFAGGGASAFIPWAAELPDTVELLAVQLPGRENRFREPFIRRMEPLASAIARAIAPRIRAPYAFLGYSLGAATAFEVASILCRMGAPMPAHLFAAAGRPPHLYPLSPRISALTDDELFDTLERLYDFQIPSELRMYPDLRSSTLATLRADFEIAETYHCNQTQPLPCAISAFSAQQDVSVGEMAVAEWRQWTALSFHCHSVPSGHFFARLEPHLLMRPIGQVLTRLPEGG